jgi:dolichol-phosphate mannosyltransferase
MALLSFIIPVYNEASAIKEILGKINSLNIDKEIIVVDDSSTDRSDKILNDIRYDNLKVIHHSSHRGQGAAFLTGLNNARGDFVIMQDAGLNYEPQEYIKLIEEMADGTADLILGSRFNASDRFLTFLINILFDVKLHDPFTCYKLFRRDALYGLSLRSSGSEIGIEMITKAIKNKFRIKQAPSSYHPSSYKEGKRIGWLGALHCILAIFKYRFIRGGHK